jgi:uncharacterized membrane protein
VEIFLFIVIIVVVIVFFNKMTSKQDEVLRNLTNLRRELDELKRTEWARPHETKIKEESPKPKPVEREIIIPEHKPEIIQKEYITVPEVKLQIAEKTEPAITTARVKEVLPPSPPKPTFWEKNPDLEKFIGENLINKIGIAILVLGIGFFVKYAIDKEWINEYGRVGIGILAGGLLIAIAHKLRKTFAAFSSVLIGGGMAVMYFTITIAFHDYHIFSQTVAFILMVVITGFTIFLSYAYNRVELAVLAIIGGFTAPFLVSTGEGNYIVLFTYLLILNIGMLVLAYLKKWNIINIVSYIFTIILYSSWLGTKVIDTPNAPYGGALVFATLFYLVFFMMNIINNVKEKRKFNALEISLILSNTFLYFSAGMVILANIEQGLYQGLFTILIAIFNFAFVLFLFKKSETDKNLLYLLIGLVLTFVSLAAPIQLEGNYITLFWAVESVLLLWLAQKSGIELLKLSNVVIVFLMMISLIMDWGNIYGQYELDMIIIFNKAFITGIVCITALLGNLILIKKETGEFFLYNVERNVYQIIMSGLLAVVIYIVFLLEISYQANEYFENTSLIYLVIGLYNYLFIIIFSLYAIRSTSEVLKGIAAGLSALGILGYLLFYQIQITWLRNNYLELKIEIGAFLFHYVIIISLLVIASFLLKLVKELLPVNSMVRRINIYFLSFLVIFMASAELTNIILLSGERTIVTLDTALSQIRKIGFPILWGVCSFILMYLGMRMKVKDLRIISLSLFGITLIKLFVFDLRGISEGGKIASFIILGIILLVISFMYQKVKALIVEESPLDKEKTDLE